jgi:ribosomal protein S18 acetylase RimI-like enzyme
MTSADPHPPARRSETVEVRPLQTDDEWLAAIENQVVCREPEFAEKSFRVFRQRQMARYRKMAEAKLGDWFGGFVGGRLVADLGLFAEAGLGRYQSVETHPEFRRRGVGGTMVFEAGRQSKVKHGLDTLVIVAERDSRAASLYQAVGFDPVEHQVGLERW